VQAESPKGEFAVNGTPKDYRFQLTADLRGPNVPQGHWTVNGQGSDQAVRDVKLSGQTLAGTLQATADATWAPAISWQATLNGEGLNPGVQWQEAPGKLNFHIKTDGGLENAALRAHLLLEELAGTLSGQAVRGNADIALQDQNLTIKALRLTAGDTRLNAEGSLTQRWDLRWTLDAPRLKSLLPSLDGSIASTGTLSGSRDRPAVAGSRDRPAVAAQFTVRNLRQGDTQIQRLRGEANVDTGGNNRSLLKVSGEGLRLGGQNWKTLSLDGSGTPAAHDLKARRARSQGRTDRRPRSLRARARGQPGNAHHALARTPDSARRQGHRRRQLEPGQARRDSGHGQGSKSRCRLPEQHSHPLVPARPMEPIQ